MHTEEELYGCQFADLINIIQEQDKNLTELMSMFYTERGNIIWSFIEGFSVDEDNPDLADYLSDYLSDEEKKDFTRNTRLARVPME